MKAGVFNNFLCNLLLHVRLYPGVRDKRILSQTISPFVFKHFNKSARITSRSITSPGLGKKLQEILV